MTQTSDDETTPPNNSIQPDNSDADLTTIDQTNNPSTSMQNPQKQDITTLDTEILSPDPTREILLRHTQNNKTKQSDNHNKNTPIQEEWIIHDKILPDDKWNTAKKTKRKTKAKNNIHMVQQTQTILKATPPINFQFLEKHQQKAYTKAANLAETLGYTNSRLQKLKLISTQEHMKHLQQLTHSKISHNRTVTFNITEHTNKDGNSNKNIITKEDLIFSVLNCTSLQESHLRSANSNPML